MKKNAEIKFSDTLYSNKLTLVQIPIRVKLPPHKLAIITLFLTMTVIQSGLYTTHLCKDSKQTCSWMFIDPKQSEGSDNIM